MRLKTTSSQSKEENVKKDKNEENDTFNLFSSFIHEYLPFKKPLLNIVGLSFLGFLFGIISPRFAQSILDEALSLRDMPMLISMAIGLITVIFLNSAVNIAKGWVQIKIAAKYDLRIGNAFWESCCTTGGIFCETKRVKFSL